MAHVEIQLSEDEWDRLHEAAQRAGMTLAAWLRVVALKAEEEPEK